MRKIILIFLFILTLFSPTQTLAVNDGLKSENITPTPKVEYDLPYPGLLPDHPLYIIKTVRDKILDFFTRNPVKKVQLHLLLSDKRLAMGDLLWTGGKKELAVSTLTKGEKYMLESAQEMVSLKKNNNLPPGLADKVELAAKKHEEIILQIISLENNGPENSSLNNILSINHQTRQQISSLK